MRCSISGSFGNREIPLLVKSLYLFRDTVSHSTGRVNVAIFKKAVWKTKSDGEFGWGGTSVKQ